MSSVPIVQGVAVNAGQQKQQMLGSNYGQQNQPMYGYQTQQNSAFGYQPTQTTSTPFNGSKGEAQPREFQDSFWAILFLVHLVIIGIVMAGMLGSSGEENAEEGEGSSVSYDYTGVVICVTSCAIAAVILSTLALGFMMVFATQLVKMALVFSVSMSLLMAILAAMTGSVLVAGLCFASFALGCCYAYFVWNRIPFAAANLRTALASVRSNLGLAIVGYLFLALAFVWSILWSVTCGGALSSAGSAVLFFFLLSYYWVHQVLQNSMHVTTAGVIGTWWFVPSEASSCCSTALYDSFCRAITHSFGSICFGSFLVALVQALRAMHRIAREKDDCSFVICIIDCILGCIEGIIEYLNKWAYVYVGLYGYSYLDAGRNVIQLFQNKGWSTIITDDLADNVLFMISMMIGLLTGLVGVAVGAASPNMFAGVGLGEDVAATTVGFVLGFLVGFLFSSIMMSIVASAVNTVIVCFAEAPAEFEQNHPQLSREMRTAWRQAWPSECAAI